MKKLYICLILLLVSSGIANAKIQGDTTSIDNLKIIRVWGTHEERGYAYGRLLAEQIAELLDKYIIQRGFDGNLMQYEMIKAWFTGYFEVEEKYKLEAQGMINGIKDAGFLPRYVQIYQREPDIWDLIAANAVVELASQLGCSAISSWGSATADDPDLNGELIITRNQDWEIHESLLKNFLLTVAFPSESDEQNWVSIGYAGLFGVLSGMNESRLGVFHNMGNYHLGSTDKRFHPIFFTTRNGLEMKDYNNDGKCSTADMVNAVDDKYQLSGFILSVVNSISNGDSAIVIECNNERGMAVRTIDDNTVEKGTNLIATNHFRKLYEPIGCDRFDRVVNTLAQDSKITIDKSWNLLTEQAGQSLTLQTMTYIPAEGWLKLSLATMMTPAFDNDPNYFDLNDLLHPLDTVSSVETLADANAVISISTYPNPFVNTVNLSIDIQRECQLKVIAYNTLGEQIDIIYAGNVQKGNNYLSWKAETLPIGAYFLKFDIIESNGQIISKTMNVVKN